MKKLIIALFLIPFTLLSQQFGNNDITIFDQSVLSIINKNAKIEILADSFVVSEGPLWDSCLLYTSPSPRDRQKSRMPSSA